MIEVLCALLHALTVALRYTLPVILAVEIKLLLLLR
jgi:hypothetical protein